MRSLLRRRYQTHFEPPPDTEIVASCIGSLNEIYAICQSSSTSFQIFKQERESSSSILANFSASSPSKVVSAQYLAENDAIVLCLDAGEVVQVVLEPEAPNAGQAEVLGDIEERIAAAKWSPDEELLVLITGQSKLLLLTKEFDVLSESPIQTQDFGQAKPVNVGWGSSDTQFRGSIGKAAGRATAETSTDDYLNKDKDVSRPTVSWRGDSAHFAVSTAEGPNPDQLRRIIRFFSRTAVLQSTAEPSPGLEHALAWQPSGSIIASTSISAATAATTSTAAQRDVIFYERNGLRRYDFPLLSAEDTVKSLTWSPDSALLAVWRSDGHRDSVQLAFRNNYHWYLKQDLSIPSGRDGSLELVDVFFDPDNAIQLFLVSSHSICSFTLQWDVISSLRPPPHDSGLVAVIDGKDLLVTPFRYENVPPPMSSYRLSSPRHPQSVPIHASFSTEDDLLLVLYQDLTFDVWQCFPALAAQDRQTPQLIYSAELKPSSGLQPIQTAIQGSLQDGIIHISVLGHRTDASTVRTASIDLKAQNIMEYPPVPGELFEQLHATLQGFVTQTGNGAFRMISIEGDEVPLDDHLSLPESCVKIQLVLQPRVPESVMIGLTGSGRLYAGQELVSAEATSFVVCGDYLIFTTASHFARFVALLDLSHPEGKIADFDPTKAQERRLERGSRIVTGITSSMTLVLQMPRGNLETICPRPLVLQVVTGDLDSLRYREAFINCRKHRIDLNLLADHDPTVFMDNLDLFLDQIPEGDHLNLFVSALRDEDVAMVTYPSKSHADRDEAWAQSKTNIICGKIRELLRDKDLKLYINTILTTHLCELPADHEAALQSLASFRKRHPEEADDAVQYIVFLADVNKLFDVALGLYDFSLTLLIAQNSQKDPKEYLPFLKELKQLPTYMQRFRIDDHLRRHAKALGNLVAAGSEHFDEVKQYVKIHQLYAEALELYEEDQERQKAIHELHGDYMYSRNKYDQAALSFYLSQNRDRAIDAYTLNNDWQQCFALALAGTTPGEGPIAMDRIGVLALDISERLKAASRYREAARVLLDYGRDVEASINASCEGADFEEALRNATLYSRSDLMQNTIGPALLEHADALLETMKEVREQIEKQEARIGELDKLRDEDADAYFGDMDYTALDGVDVDDSASTAVGTAFTRYTKNTNGAISRGTRASSGSTAKSRRKEERKKAAGGKKGTVWEEEYLLGSMSRMCETRLPSLQNEVSQALPLLLRLGGKSGSHKAKSLQGSLQEVEHTLHGSIESVWANDSPRHPEILASRDLIGVVKKPVKSSSKWTLEMLQS